MLLKSGKKFLSVLVASVAVLGISANLVPKVSAVGGRLFEVMDRVGEDKHAEELLAMVPTVIKNYSRCSFYYNDDAIFPSDEFDDSYDTEILCPEAYEVELDRRWAGGQKEMFCNSFGKLELESSYEAPLWTDIADTAETAYPSVNPWLRGGAAYAYVALNYDLFNEVFLRNAINAVIDKVSEINSKLENLVTSGRMTKAQLEGFENNYRERRRNAFQNLLNRREQLGTSGWILDVQYPEPDITFTEADICGSGWGDDVQYPGT